MSALSERLKELRGNLSQEEAAKWIGITPQTLGRYENDKRKPDSEVLVMIAKYYKVSVDYLLGLSKNSSIEPDVQIAMETTGLSRETVEILNYFNNENWCKLLKSIDLIVKNSVDDWGSPAGLLDSICIYLSLQEENNFDLHITSRGNLAADSLTKSEEKTHWEDLMPHAVIDKNSIIETVLLNKITESLKEMREIRRNIRSKEKEAENNGKHNPTP